MSYEHLKKTDPEVYEAIRQEIDRQQSKLELIASENFVSEAVMEAISTPLTNKYAEGYPGKRYYGGCEFVDVVENLAIQRCCELFGVKYANVQPHSGTQANLAVYLAFLEPGDRILGMDLSHGGHLSHGMAKNMSGSVYEAHFYQIEENGMIDYDKLLAKAKQVQPKMIVVGASAYPRTIDFKKFKEIAVEVGAILFADIAHIAGLVATGLHPTPVGHADVITTTTHKTLRGTRGGVIMTNDDTYIKKINSAVFPGSQGGPLMHVIAAKAVGFAEALKPSFKTYQEQIIKNAKALADAFIKRDVKLVAGGTDNHLMLLDLRGTGVTGKELQHRLDEVNITTNKNGIPNDPEKPFVTSGLRVGTPAVTTRGLVESDMDIIADMIVDALRDYDAKKASIIERVAEICQRYPLYINL
ncbi:MAG: serine hydroxymethyltransferase [Fastidiosipilaceae bacterium]|jgi:glycine hydroxymethyltransferase|nr:serine hydroxymethyltransferase [Clostridiaceae bacterium]